MTAKDTSEAAAMYAKLCGELRAKLSASDKRVKELEQELAIYKALMERVSMQQADKDFAEALRKKPFKE